MRQEEAGRAPDNEARGQPEPPASDAVATGDLAAEDNANSAAVATSNALSTAGAGVTQSQLSVDVPMLCAWCVLAVSDQKQVRKLTSCQAAKVARCIRLPQVLQLADIATAAPQSTKPAAPPLASSESVVAGAMPTSSLFRTGSLQTLVRAKWRLACDTRWS